MYNIIIMLIFVKHNSLQFSFAVNPLVSNSKYQFYRNSKHASYLRIYLSQHY